MPPAPAGPAASQARQHLLELLGPLVDRAGYDLEDVAITAAGRRSLVRVIVDADGGIDLDAVAQVSRLVSDVLDTDAAGAAAGRILGGAYVLEVSSPGVDRPLSEPKHWRRATGRLVGVELGGRPATGRVVEVDDLGVTLDVDGDAVRAGWGDLGPGRVQVEFSRGDSTDDDSTDDDSTDNDSTDGDDSQDDTEGRPARRVTS